MRSIAQQRQQRSLVPLGNTPSGTAKVTVIGARLAIAASAAVVFLLVSLHILSPEFDPSFRMVSEYALGWYVWVLSLLFLSWGISSWALAVALWGSGSV